MSMDKARKVLTIKLQFELGERKAHGPKLKAAYDAAVKAAIEAVEQQLLEGSVANVRTDMTYDYRWMGFSTEQSEAPEEDWPEPEDGPSA